MQVWFLFSIFNTSLQIFIPWNNQLKLFLKKTYFFPYDSKIH